jgi:RHS repeat-associated protein
MRRAYLASTVLTDARNTEKSHTIVGHDFLNARFYDSSRGQFLSRDPVFWETKQNISDPQSLNSYAYSENSPIVRSDPSGKCFWDGCVVESVAAFGAVSGVAVQAYSDYQTGAFSRRSISGNIGTYSLAAGGGAFVAGAGALVGVEAAGLGLLSRLGLGALTSGSLTAGTEVGINYVTNQKTDPAAVAVDSSVAALTDGILHHKRFLRFKNFVNRHSGTSNTKSPGFGNGVGNFISIYNSGSKSGTYNFGTGQ